MTTETITPPLEVAPAPDAAPALVRAARARRWAWNCAWIVVPCGVAAALVMYQLGTRSLWLDEAATVSIASQHGGALWHAIGHDGGNMLGYYLLQHVLIGWFGDGAAVVRLPSALATVATVALVALIARRMLGRRGAFAAALICAVSLPLVFWGQDARAYALMMTFITGSFLALLVVWDGGASPLAWVAYAGCIVLAAYMSFVALLVVPAQLLVLVWRRERVRVVLSAALVSAACCAPLAVLASRRGSGQLFWVPPPNLRGLGQTARWLTSGGMPPNFHSTATMIPLLALTLGCLTWAAVVAVRTRSWPVLLMLSWLLVPMLLSLAESLAGQPILLYRNSLVSLPAVAVLLAFALMRPGTPRWLGWSGLGVLIALRALQLAPSYGASPENWKAAARYLDARAQAGDCIAFYPSDGRMAFRYYARASAQSLVPVLPAAPWSDARPYVEQYRAPSPARLDAIESSCRRVWLLASHFGAANGPAAARHNYVRYILLRDGLNRAYVQHSSATFGWASPVRVDLLSRPAAHH